MKSTAASTLYDLSLPELRARAARARELLSEAKSRLAGPLAAVKPDRAGAIRCVDEVFADVDRLLPGFFGRPRSLLSRIIEELSPIERQVLRSAVDDERVARERLARLLGHVSAAQAEDALERIEAQESLRSEMSALLRLSGRAHFEPRSA
jgi:hypothetical protein